MPSQEICLLRWELIKARNGFLCLFVHSTWQWVAYLERRDPSNIILKSPEINVTDSVLISSNQLKRKFQQGKEHSYFEINNILRKQNWKPAAFDVAGMATTFLRDK